MTQIVAISGRKQAGKDTTANTIVGMRMHQLELISDFAIGEDGRLRVPSQQEEGIVHGIFDLDRRDSEFVGWCCEQVFPYVKVYSFAGPLKDFCVRILGCPEENVWGPNEKKDELSDLLWENTPKEIFNRWKKEKKTEPRMTYREAMQIVGEIFRGLDPDCWAKATIRQIQAEQPLLALIRDTRYPNEVDVVQKAGGQVWRLTRTPFPDDSHSSETALDKENFDWAKFDRVIDNAEMTLQEQVETIVNIVVELDQKQEVAEV